MGLKGIRALPPPWSLLLDVALIAEETGGAQRGGNLLETVNNPSSEELYSVTQWQNSIIQINESSPSHRRIADATTNPAGPSEQLTSQTNASRRGQSRNRIDCFMSRMTRVFATHLQRTARVAIVKDSIRGTFESSYNAVAGSMKAVSQ